MFDENLLDVNRIIEWQKNISENKIKIITPKLKDHGTSIIKKVIGNKKHFVKFYGTGSDRVDWGLGNKKFS